MKRLYLSGFAIIVFCAFLFVASLQSIAQEVKGPILQLSQESLKLGEISVAELETFNEEIEFTNSGDQPLILTQVRGCCGTRIIDWPREPIAPGEKGIIKIQFRLAPRPHAVRRTVTIATNEEGGQRVFRILGEVVEETTERKTR